MLYEERRKKQIVKYARREMLARYVFATAMSLAHKKVAAVREGNYSKNLLNLAREAGYKINERDKMMGKTRRLKEQRGKHMKVGK